MTDQVEISARVKPIVEEGRLRFRDLNGNGVLDPYEDWRLSPAERAEDLVARMTPEEKIGLMVINSRRMGISQPDPELTSHDGALDEQYHRIKNDPHNTAGLPYEGTTQQITDLHMRHFIMRETPAGLDHRHLGERHERGGRGDPARDPGDRGRQLQERAGRLQDGRHRRTTGTSPSGRARSAWPRPVT